MVEQNKYDFWIDIWSSLDESVRDTQRLFLGRRIKFALDPYFVSQLGCGLGFDYRFGDTKVSVDRESNNIKCQAGSEILYACPERFGLRTRYGLTPSFLYTWAGTCPLVDGELRKVNVYAGKSRALGYEHPNWKKEVMFGGENDFTEEFPPSIKDLNSIRARGVDENIPWKYEPKDFAARFIGESQIEKFLKALGQNKPK